jgi:hypothetical protein
MKRREAIKSTIIGLGGMAGISSLDLLVACTSNKEKVQPGVFTNNQMQSLVAAIDQIIPETNTASASQAGVPAFIEVALSECFENDAQDLFKKGLDLLSANGDFYQLSFEKQTEILKGVEDAGGEEGEFFGYLKNLTLIGYFTSEEGIKQNFEYQPIPGKYQGCIPFTSSSKPWRGNRL